MITTEILDAVRDVARSFTEKQNILTFSNPDLPLAVFADGYNVDATPNKIGMSDKLAASVESHFEDINQVEIENVTEERDVLISNVHAALAKIQHNTQNVIIPNIKAMSATYAEKQSISSQADIRVEPFEYDPIHNDPRLVNHIQTRYNSVRPIGEYKTYLLNNKDASAIIELVANNNPHFEQEEVTEWALKIPTADIEAVWSELFTTNRILVPNDISFLKGINFPFDIDKLTLAYFICGHYIDNPEQVSGESVTAEEWERNLRLLHELFGFYLVRTYEQRTEYREQQVLVLKYDASNPVEKRRVHVVLNGDVSDAWLQKGDVQAILGAAISGYREMRAEGIDARADYFVDRWIHTWPLIKQASMDYAEACRRNNAVETFIQHASSGILAERSPINIREVIVSVLRTLNTTEFENTYTLFAKLICKVYFPELSYQLYLDTLDEYAQQFPKATLREVSTQALLSLVAIFLAQQIKVVPYEPDVDPDAQLPEVEEVSTPEEESLVNDEAVTDETLEVEETEIEEDDPYANVEDETDAEEETPLA